MFIKGQTLVPEPTRAIDKGKEPQTNSQLKGDTIQKVVEPPRGKTSKGNLKSTLSTIQNTPSTSRPNG